MSQITSRDDIKKLGTIMGVWAHPDDETFTSAGIMATAVENGQTVICVTATRGEGGVQNESRWPTDRLKSIRETELNAALEVIGVKNHHWLGYPDGGCQMNDNDAVKTLQQFIEKYKPDTILTFGADGMTGHSDHKAVCNWAIQAVKNCAIKPVVYHAIQTRHQYENSLGEMDKKLNIYFNVDQPRLCEPAVCDIYFELDQTLQDVKYQALKVMPSQTESMLTAFPDKVISESLSPEAFVLEP